MSPSIPISDTLQKRTHHFVSRFKIEDRPRANWSMHVDTAWLTPQELKSLMPNGHNCSVVSIDSDNRRLVQQYPFVGVIDKCVGGSEVNSQFMLEKLFNKLHGNIFLLQTGRGFHALQSD